MATSKHFLVVGGLVAGLFLGCNREANREAGNAEQTGNQANAQAQAAKAEAEKEASEARRTTREALAEELDTLGTRIDSLENLAEKAGAKLKRGLKDEIARLEQAKERVEAKLEGLDEAGAETFPELSAGVDRSLDSLGDAINRTWKDVTGKERQAVVETGETQP